MDRVILHIDANAFYASVETVKKPELARLPMAVASSDDGRHGVILSKNERAKPFGVKAGESVLDAFKKCPHLLLVAPSHRLYAEYSRKLNAIYRRYTDQVEPASIDESYLDVTGSLALFGSGKNIADGIRESVKEELHLTVSAGVSFCKLFAKMGSDYKKPDATTELRRDNYREILSPLPVSEMMFVGDAAAARLQSRGIRAIGDLFRAERETLVSLLGKGGGDLYDRLMAGDTEPVLSPDQQGPPKSISNGVTFPHPLTGDDLRSALLALCDSAAARLRAEGFLCRSLGVQIKDPNLRVISRQTTLRAPTHSTREIYISLAALVDRVLDKNAPVRMLTVALSGFVSPDEGRQQSIFTAPEQEEKSDRLYETLDTIRARFGSSAIRPAGTLRFLAEDNPGDR